MRLSTKDIKIAGLLRNTINIDSVAKSMGLSRSAIYYHLDKLKKRGAVRGYRLLLNDGKNTSVAVLLIELRDTRMKKDMYRSIEKHDEMILDLYELEGRWDFMVVLVGKKQKLEEFVRNEINQDRNTKRSQLLFVSRKMRMV